MGDSKKKFHLIGIGGIGMSALARFLISKNYSVTGSDSSTSNESLKVKNEGIKVYNEHSEKNIEDSQTTVVYSTAISEDNPEILSAKEKKCLLWHRSDLLAFLAQSYDSIAVAGTHGKTSTSALLSHVLLHANVSPSFVIGGLVKPQNTNSSVGKGTHFVLEADESDGSFLKYHPNGAILTNMEVDHLNHYKNFEEIKQKFKQFTSQVQNKEIFFWCQDCPNLNQLHLEGISYGFSPEADLRICNFKQKGSLCSFDLLFKEKKYEKIVIPLIGKHNALNSAAIFGLCLQLGIEESLIYAGFKTFLGVQRRTDLIGQVNQIHIYDDYAHHPTEVECLLKSLRQAFPKRRILAIFQPHRYTRFQPMQQAFSSSFKKASNVWITDVYACNEKPTKKIDLQKVAQEIEDLSSVSAAYVPYQDLESTFEREVRPFDVVVTIGAGNITAFAKRAYEIISEKKPKLKLALIQGGVSYEHYVSLVSSKFYESAIDQSIYQKMKFQISPMGEWLLIEEEGEKTIAQEEVIKALSECDCILPLGHGKTIEDGQLQGFLKMLNLPFIGANHKISSYNMNKIWMKLFVKELGIKVPEGLFLNLCEWQKKKAANVRKIEKKLQYPIVVKPASLGSTIGVTFANNQVELKEKIEQTFLLDEQIVIEERVLGRELEVSCLETEKGLIVAYPGEVKSDKRHYDYEAKYSQNPIEKIVRPQLEPHIVKKAKAYAKMIYQKMQIKSFARIDFFLTKKELIFAEVNTLPGTTPRSLFQRTLLDKEIKAEEMIHQMVIDGLYRHRQEHHKSFQIKQFLKAIKNVTHQ